MDLFGLGSCLTQTQLEHFGWGRLELATDREGMSDQMDWASSGGRRVLVRVGFGRGVEISLDLARSPYISRERKLKFYRNGGKINDI